MVPYIIITTKWSKSGEWKSMWVRLLDKHRNELDMSGVDLDGSHTAALRGGEEVGYQGQEETEDDQRTLPNRQAKDFRLPCLLRNPANTMTYMT